jgi:adenine-specific DNA glycosylase
MAILMYCHGMSMTSIGFILGVTTKTVLVWIRDHARALPWKQDISTIGRMELDEMHHYLGQKNSSSGSGKLFVVTHNGLPRGLWVDGMKEPPATS